MNAGAYTSLGVDTAPALIQNRLMCVGAGGGTQSGDLRQPAEMKRSVWHVASAERKWIDVQTA